MKLDSNRVFRGICHVMRCDPDIMTEAPAWEHSKLIGEAALLGVVGLVSGIAWTNFWWTFVSFPVALFIGCIAFVIIVLMDVAIGAADWRLEGVLRHPGARHGRGWWCRLGLRLGVSLVFSLATSEGAIQVFCHDAIAAQLERDVQSRNNATETRFVKRGQELRQQRFGTLITEIDRLNAIVKETTGPLDKAQESQATAQNHLATAEREIERQRRGLDGYARGCAQKCQAAIKDADAARAELAKATAEVGNYKPRFDEARTKLNGAKSALATAEAGIRDDIAALEREKRLQMVAVRSDPLLNFIALQEVYRDPETGSAARYFTWVMIGLLLTAELLYLMVRIIFAHASVYTALLIKDAKLRAERAEAEYRRESDALRAWSGAPPPILPPIKLISWEDPAERLSPDNDVSKHGREPPDDDLEAAE